MESRPEGENGNSGAPSGDRELARGDRSPTHIKEMLAAVSQAVLAAEHIVLRGQGHTAHVRAPEQVAGAIEAFADNVLRQR